MRDADYFNLLENGFGCTARTCFSRINSKQREKRDHDLDPRSDAREELGKTQDRAAG